MRMKENIKYPPYLFVQTAKLQGYFTSASLVILHPYEPPHDKTNKMTGPPPSLIRVFAVCSAGAVCSVGS